MSTASVTTSKALVRPTTGQHSIRRAGLLAGLGLVVMAALAAFANFGVLEGLVTSGNATKTADDILASQGLFQAGIVAWYLIVALDVFVAWALYRFFRPVSERVSKIAAWSRVVYVSILAIAVTRLIDGLHLVGQGSDALALERIESFTSIWDVGLVLFGAHLILLGYLAYRSGYVSRIVAGLTGIAGFGYIFDGFVTAVSEGASFKISAITGMGEVALAVWLLARARRMSIE